MFSVLMTPICHQFCAYIQISIQMFHTIRFARRDFGLCDFKFFKNLQKADYWDEPIESTDY